MIKGSSYNCANADAPALATLVCCEEGCTLYPFLCGQYDCQCTTLHLKHQYKPIQRLLGELPPKPPEDLSKVEQDIDNLIDSLITNLHTLKQHLRTDIEKHSIGALEITERVHRLLSGEPTVKATGDSICKLVADINRINTVQSTYQSIKEQLQKELRIAETTAQQLTAPL